MTRARASKPCSPSCRACAPARRSTTRSPRPIDLASAAPRTLFARHFGMDKGAWMAQPAVTRIDCAAACAREVAAAAARGSQLLAIAGDLSLDGPIALGTAERPVVVMATGTIRINGAVD